MIPANRRTALSSCIALSLIAGAGAQTRTNYTYCGNTTAVGVLNGARIVASVSSTPGIGEELTAEGNFLGYSGGFYSAQMESYSWGPARVGIGLCSMRVGANTVRTIWATTAVANPSTSVRQDVFAGNTSKQFNIAAVPVIVSGNVEVNMSASFACTWPANGIVIDGTMSGDATGRTTAALASAAPFLGASSSTNLQFGRQQFSGRGEVWATGNLSNVRYDLTPMTIVLSASLRLFGAPISIVTLVNASRAAVTINPFR